MSKNVGLYTNCRRVQYITPIFGSGGDDMGDGGDGVLKNGTFGAQNQYLKPVLEPVTKTDSKTCFRF